MLIACKEEDIEGGAEDWLEWGAFCNGLSKRIQAEHPGKVYDWRSIPEEYFIETLDFLKQYIPDATWDLVAEFCPPEVKEQNWFKYMK